MAFIELSNISKHYGAEGFQTTALDDVSLSINEGEFVALMGPSGSGKSTLMHIIGLLDRQSGGTYQFADKDTAGMTQWELAHLRLKKIGFVFQSFNLLPRTNALENVMLPMVYAGLSQSSRDQRANELLKRVGLEEYVEHTPAELSGGQMQRVAIARALANQPPLILADEPTGNLDSAAGGQVLELLKSLHKEGATVVIVTHDHEIAAQSNRTVTLRDGRVVSDETTVVSARKKDTAKAKTPKKTKAKNRRGAKKK